MARRFTLLDDPYFEALVTVNEALTDAGVPFALVGGGAAQAWIANLRTDGGERRLSDEPVLRSALRKTRDLDFSLRTEPSRMLTMLNELALARGSGTHVLGPRALRLGPIALSFTLAPEDLSGMSDHYDELLASRGALRLRRSAEPQDFPVIGLAELIATKLTRRGDKAKDLVDVEQLVAALKDAGRSLDLEPARRLVGNDAGARALLDELVQRLEGGRT